MEIASNILEAVNQLEKSVTEVSENMDFKMKQLEIKMQEKDMKINKSLLKRPLFQDHYEENTTDFKDYLRKGLISPALETKSLSSTTEAAGGYLIPHTLDQKIYEAVNTLSPIRKLASVMTISSDALELVMEKDKPEVGWVGEVDGRSETKSPEFMKVRIPVHQIYAKPKVSQKLLDDVSVNLEGWLIENISQQMTVLESISFVNGDGKGKPRGFLSYERDMKTKGENGKFQEFRTGKVGSFVDSDVLLDAFHSLKSEYLPEAVWLMSRSAFTEVRKLKDENSGHFLCLTSDHKDAQVSLLGKPIYICEDMPSMTTQEESTPIVFGNLKSAYQIVDRQGMSILRDPYSAKPFVEFYATKRVGGDVIRFDALKMISSKENE